jgi:hypothetical protein
MDYRVPNFLIAIALLLGTSGCAALATPGVESNAASSAASTAGTNAVSSPSMFDYATKSTEVAYMSPAALLTEHSGIEESVRHEQCYFKTPDPMFFVPEEAANPTWTLAGRLDSDRHFHSAEYRSILTLGLVEGSQQTSSWPVELVSLADMPQVFLDQRLPIIGQAKLPADDQHELDQEYLQQARHIQNVVGRLEETFDARAMCYGHFQPSPAGVAMQPHTAS